MYVMQKGVKGGLETGEQSGPKLRLPLKKAFSSARLQEKREG